MRTPTNQTTQSSRASRGLRTLIILAVLGSLSACSWFQFPGVYRIDIQQGNIVTQDMVDQLQLGMTKRQVNYVLGTALIQDSFNLDRWDYYYSMRSSSGNFTQRKFTVYFENDALIRTEGEFQIQPAPIPDEQLEPIDEGFSSTNSGTPNDPTNGTTVSL